MEEETGRIQELEGGEQYYKKLSFQHDMAIALTNSQQVCLIIQDLQPKISTKVGEELMSLHPNEELLAADGC